jgi:filamentous hemagglutinin family protein
LSGPSFAIPDTVGQTRGQNLFHSFGRFDLSAGESATFTGPDTIHNVITRVTGAASMIDGTLQCDIAGANFFFINPFGVTFGPNAQVNVSGSFAVTTADHVQLADGGRFDARNPANDILTAAPVSAFGFLGPTRTTRRCSRSCRTASPSGLWAATSNTPASCSARPAAKSPWSASLLPVHSVWMWTTRAPPWTRLRLPRWAI